MIIPRPTHNDTEEIETRSDDGINPFVTQRFIRFWHVSDWKCIVCGAVMFGRVKECVYCKFAKGIRTPRPSDYIELPYD